MQTKLESSTGTKKTALLFLNGKRPSYKLTRYFWRRETHRFAVDGAANYLMRAGLTPDLILGDLDSLNTPAQNYFKSVEKVLLPDQNYTDADKAIGYLIDKGFNQINVLAFDGGRIDHCLHHFGLLNKYADVNCEPVFWKDSEKIYLFEGKLDLKGKSKRRVSFFSLFGKVKITKAQGFAYNLEGFELEFGKLSSVSNLINSDHATLELESGKLCCVEEILITDH